MSFSIDIERSLVQKSEKLSKSKVLNLPEPNHEVYYRPRIKKPSNIIPDEEVRALGTSTGVTANSKHLV